MYNKLNKNCDRHHDHFIKITKKRFSKNFDVCYSYLQGNNDP